ncbi:predicted protein [Naegleria gruberi]|uniref:Predicted protein n=1 Tax=Naegleria gruberi TaxID=5762 RepID=D2UXN6_NAEGR|nr:uncharacterized protein NAEGRDRAFT_61190 [Naegleria gruberi]EFC50316.1 predicted protein [Naegleria gruberi]|eukprot:XP_002683060.1 predicted protein [Naegleria gruberi strain NEG-M]
MSYSPTQIQHTQVQEDDEEQSNGSESPQEESSHSYIATQIQDNDDMYDEEDDQPTEQPTEEQYHDEEEQSEEKQQKELEFDEEEKEEPKKSSKKKKKKLEVKEKKRRQKKDDDDDYQDEEESEKSVNEEDENNDEEVDKKKKRKRLQKGKEKRKKKKESNEETSPSNEDDSSLIHDEENEGSSRSKQNVDDDEFNKYVLKEVKSRRSASTDKLEATAQPQAAEIIKRMTAAYSDDVEAYHKKKPALNKLQLLPEVIESCKKIYLQGHLISEGILGALEKWIVPDKDLPHPSINIQTGVLTILNDLPVSSSYEGDEKWITRELLKSSKIPKTIKQIANNPSTTPSNRKLAKKIVERWSRLVYQLPSEYGELYKKQAVMVDETPQPSPKQTSSFSKSSEPIQRKKPKSNSIRASIPRKESFDFTRLPPSKPLLKKEKAENEVHKRLLNVGNRKR